MKKIASFVLAGFIGGAASLGALKFYSDLNRHEQGIVADATPVHQASFVNGGSAMMAADFTKASENTINCVVHIQTVSKGKAGMNPFQDFFFGNPFGQSRPQLGSGSGVIISEDGYIVTNNHVIEGADEIEVTLNDKRTYKARVIGTDPSTDLALVQVQENKLPYITFANSDDVKVGQWVLAVGNPFNLTSTVTAGIVSAKSRKIDIIHKDLAIESFIQTDAAVNPGNSGGALVNTNGELVGINSAIASNTGSYTGYSFAIPSNLVKKIINDLAEYGKVQRAFIGVSIRDIDAKFAKDRGFNDLRGVYLDNVTQNGAASEAGLQKGDIIKKINDRNTSTVSELQEQIALYRPGDKVNVTVNRNGKEEVLSVTLKNSNGNPELAASRSDVIKSFGAEFEELGNEMGNIRGLRVKSVSAGKFRGIGIKEGYIITKVNNEPVETLEMLENVIARSESSVYIEGIYPNGTRAYYAFGI